MLHLSAGLLAAAAFEAYLNYAGEQILPTIWEQERTFFNSQKYRGTMGKLKRIAEEIAWPLPAKSRKPLSGVVELQSLRDKMVHGRTKRETYRRVHKADQNAPFPALWLFSEARRVRALISDVEALGVELHTAINQSAFKGCVLGAHPFLGMLGLDNHEVLPGG